MLERKERKPQQQKYCVSTTQQKTDAYPGCGVKK